MSLITRSNSSCWAFSDGLVGRMRHRHAVAAAFEHHFHAGAGVEMIVHHQHARARGLDACCLSLSAACGAFRLGIAAAAAGAATVSRVTIKVAPRSLPATLRFDRCHRAPPPLPSKWRGPSPRPPNRRVIELWPCSKALKILSILSASMPMPVSVVRISICSGDGLNVSITIRPFAGVNFTLFLIRFQKTCCRRAGSPST